jgi:ubiquinone/menaquinone biosynthesis C-methylase UbiE
MTDYSSQVYWENRYLNDHMEIFEWYQTYDSLKEKIIDFLKPEDQILYIGCGTSKLAEDLYIDEFKNVTNIDFSENAIKIMEDRYKEQKVEMIYKVMNAENMSEFSDGQFNVVIDKALLDSMLCGENALPIVDKMINEVHRVLSNDGIFIIVSNGDENNRKNLFNLDLWEYQMMEIEKPSKVVVLDEKDPKNYHYIYVLTKKGKEEEENKEEGEENVNNVEGNEKNNNNNNKGEEGKDEKKNNIGKKK